MPSTPIAKLTIAQVRIGDVLIRQADHLGRPDARYRVREIRKTGRRAFVLEGYWTAAPQYGSTLTAENLHTVERNGAIVGSFFVKYW